MGIYLIFYFNPPGPIPLYLLAGWQSPPGIHNLCLDVGTLDLHHLQKKQEKK